MGTDKRKFAILAILGLGLVAVGAWQFVGKSGGAPITPRQKFRPSGESLVADNSETPENTMDPAIAALPRKDPFAPGKLSPEPTTNKNPKVIVAPPDEVARAKNAGRPSHGRNTGPLIPRFDPNNVQVSPIGGGGPSASYSSPNAPSGYELIGVVDGPNPVAVFRSSSGNQTMVKVNGHVGQGGRIVGIKNGRVTVQQGDGSTKTLSVGGNSQ